VELNFGLVKNVEFNFGSVKYVEFNFGSVKYEEFNTSFLKSRSLLHVLEREGGMRGFRL